MTAFTASEAKRAFSDILNRVAYAKEQIIVTRRGKTLAGIVPAEDLVQLRRLAEEKEDQLDAAEAKAALRAFRKSGKKAIPIEKAFKEMGL